MPTGNRVGPLPVFTRLPAGIAFGSGGSLDASHAAILVRGSGLRRRAYLLVEVHVPRLRTPYRPDEHEQGAYHQQGQRRVLEGHEAGQTRLVESVERRGDNRQAVAEAEARGPDTGPEALVDVGGRQAPRRGYHYHDQRHEENNRKEALRGHAYEQVVEEGADRSHDDGVRYQVRPSSNPLADHAGHHVSSGED